MESLKTNVDVDSVHEILVIVYAKNTTKISLQVAYIIHTGSAKWTASYDARVSSGEQKLELNYYGNIINSSGEDWNNVNLSLSTAQPSIAGKPPELTTKFVTIKQHVAYKKNAYSYDSINPTSNMAVQRSVFKASNLREADDDFDDDAGMVGNKSSDTLTTTTFVIPRKSTITADSKTHKVTIRTLPFVADFTYTVIPKLSLNAYLKASIKNNTKNIPLLPGPMNVFVDNNFVAKSDIPLLNPNESLGVFLGIDSSIKIEYLPVTQLRDTQGIISKTNKLNIKYNITITNNKNKDIKLELFDNLPKSNDSSIKVKLVEPEIPESAKTGHQPAPSTPKSINTATNDQDWGGVALTPANNVHWKISIAAGSKKEIPFGYTVDYPIDVELCNAY